MDTYFNTNSKCVQCGRCIRACKEHGEDFLRGHRDDCPHEKYEYVPCHHCTNRFSRPAPCQEVCHYNAIKIERW